MHDAFTTQCCEKCLLFFIYEDSTCITVTHELRLVDGNGNGIGIGRVTLFVTLIKVDCRYVVLILSSICLCLEVEFYYCPFF